MSSPSVTLIQDVSANLPGINLAWSYANFGTPKDIQLSYIKSGGGGQWISLELASGLRSYQWASGFVSGQSYTFILQAINTSNAKVTSQISIVAPYFLSPPSISSIVGFDNALQIQLAATDNAINSSKANVIFTLLSSDGDAVMITKPFASNGLYRLSSSDDAELQNGATFDVACVFDPITSSSNPYTVASPASNTVSATPSDYPNVPTNLSITSVGTNTIDVLCSWTKPSDFAQWSNNFSIFLELLGSSDQHGSNVTLVNQDVQSYTFTDISRNQYTRLSMKYINSFGDGDGERSGLILPTCIPDAPTLISVVSGDAQATLTWAAPSFNGQTAITGYKVYKGGVNVATVSASTFSYVVTGLGNGNTYNLYVVAVNAVGSSVPSSTLQASPYGQMSIVSAVASGKSLTVVLNPNGKPIQSLYVFALDSTPNDITDGSFFQAIPQQQIPQGTTSNVSVGPIVFDFDTDIDFFGVIAHNQVNSATYLSR